MIEINNVTKRFGDFTALQNISINVESGSIYGLVGYNGAGKTTLLKTIAGIYRPDRGEVLVDGYPSFDNEAVKQNLFFIPDNFYFLPQATLKSMAAFYQGYYPTWNYDIFYKLVSFFELNPAKRIHSFSKGMQRQASLILALSCCPATLLLDETFDGLDPFKRSLAKKILLEYLMERQPCIIIASHNLSEIESLCDHVGLLDGSGVSLSSSTDDIQNDICKYRVVFNYEVSEENFQDIPHKQFKKSGSIISFVARGEENAIRSQLQELSPLMIETFPLSLEEVFLFEMEDKNYDVTDIFA